MSEPGESQTPPPYGQQPSSPYGEQPSWPSGQQPTYPSGQPTSPYAQPPYTQSPYGQSPYPQSPYTQSPYGQSPYPPAPQYPPYGAYGYPQPQQGTNGLAIASLILAFLCSPAGLVCGIIALTQIGPRRQAGHGIAVAGIVLSALFFVLGVAIYAGSLP